MRIEKDVFGQVEVPADKYWGAETERFLENFKIGNQEMPMDLIYVLALVKKTAALLNKKYKRMDPKIADAIGQACDEIRAGKLEGNFPLVVWQTGSATHTHMNVNEVIANRAIEILGGKKGSKTPVHPNNHVSLGQSSNDTLPTAMHIVTTCKLHEDLLPSLQGLWKALSLK